MNRLKALSPRLWLVVAGVGLGLLARQVFGPPEENAPPPLSIDRPIAEGLELEEPMSLEKASEPYAHIDLPIQPVEQTKP